MNGFILLDPRHFQKIFLSTGNLCSYIFTATQTSNNIIILYISVFSIAEADVR
jgi:hypothetical protein